MHLIVIFFAFQAKSFAQDSTLVFEGSLQAAAVNNDTPFWLQMNQYGAIPTNGSFLSGKWGLYKIYNSPSPSKDRIPVFNWSAGARLISNATQNKTDFFFTDLFVALKVGPVELSAGQREEFMGLGDSTLTSGSVAMSRNARPIPKIQLSIPEFLNLPFTDSFIGIKASYSDGLLGPAAVQYGNTNYVPNVYLHQKSLYIRLGRPWQKLNFYGGANHQAMWGGEEKIFSGGLPTSTAYKYVVFGKSWASSRVGNHFGTIDMAAELKTKNWEFFLYRQNIYEDGSLSELSNISDGLNGLRLKNRNFVRSSKKGFQIRSLVFEFLNTKSQGGAVFDFDAGIFGADNYFNHYVYTQGWSYRQRALGTPMAIPQNFLNENISTQPGAFTLNNRLAAFHLGMDARWCGLDLRLLTTYSSNLGTYVFPISPAIQQFSLLVNVSRHFPALFNSQLSASASGDIGNLYKNNTAFAISWTKKVTLN